jgi:hypothetical protein
VFALYVVSSLLFTRKGEVVPELEEREPEGKMGLILPLSTIALVGGGTGDRERLPKALERLSAEDGPVSESDYELLERTNLESPFRAVEYHFKKGTLRDCWLITTEDVSYPDGSVEGGSGPAAKILERWFFHRYPEANVRFHYGPDLRVHPRGYARLWLIVDELFERAPYKAANMVVDITPGTKLMSIALALACQEPSRSMQYIVSGRDPLTGEVLPRAERRPICVDISRSIYWKEGAETRAP